MSAKTEGKVVDEQGISAIVLAAGLSKRMGKPNKLLLDLKGKTVIEHVVGSLCATRTHFSPLAKTAISEIIVVLGHEAELVKNALRQYQTSTQFVYNPDYKQGMTSSIQAGVQASSLKSKGFLICLSDLPFISTHTYQQIAQHFLPLQTQYPQAILRPTFRGKWGNPVVFSSHYKTTILQHPIPTGCKAIIQQNKQAVHQISLSTKHILLDIDTPEAYQKLK